MFDIEYGDRLADESARHVADRAGVKRLTAAAVCAALLLLQIVIDLVRSRIR